ncbi:MAG: type IV pilus secretin PilQ [Betaproteobacteria bacterium]|nr:type IV pilus secretin PilQ [Betaproteobacteria bacterium]
MITAHRFLRGLAGTAAVFLLAVLAAAPSVAQTSAGAGNSIESLDVSTVQGGRIVVKIGLKEALANPPAGFALNDPPRLALDLPNTGNALGKSAQDVNQGELRSVNIVQAGNRTRLVFNLTQPVGYDVRLDGKSLLISLQGSATAAAAPTTTRFAEAKAGPQAHAIRDVEFRRGAAGEARIVVDLSDTGTGIDIRQQGRSLIVDFTKTGLPRNLERRLDVTDFATPVQTVDTFGQGENVRMVVESKGLWEHSAYQTDTRFILEVKPIVEDPTKLTQGIGYTGEKLSLNFQNVEVRAVLQVIADFTGLNIITSDTVGGNLTLRLKDVPWDQALDIILQAKGLDMRKTGNVVLIAPRDEIATKEKILLEARQQISDLEPTRTEAIQLNYQKADEVRKILSDPTQKLLSKRGSVVVDTRTNTLFVQDNSTRLEEIRKLIKKIDVPVRQVMIEARIVEANDNFSKNIGVRLGYHDLTGRGTSLSNIGLNQQRLAVGGNLNDTGLHSGQGAAAAFTDSLSVNLPSTGAGGFGNAGVLSLLLFNEASTKFLNLELSALEADNKGKIIASPRVVTADQVEATIESGTDIPYQQATSSGATSVSFKKATLSLKVKPQITPDDNIIMSLNVNKDSVGAPTAAGPAINTKQITTQVLVQNGGTVVIGGIYNEEERKTQARVPVLGELPYVGFLFRNTITQSDRSELLIFVTPRVLKESLNIR